MVENSGSENNKKTSDLLPAQERSGLPVAFLIGIVIVSLLVGAVLLYNKLSGPAGPEVEKPLPVGPEETGYAPNIHFLEPKMSRAANFLNQEVTYVFFTVENAGTRKVQQIEVTLEFHDPFNQVVLRDRQRLFLPNAPPFEPGQQRDVQVPYEHIPAQWNMVFPTVTVTGLSFK